MKQRGFTLIELVVVIVILGILAATAIPKFIDLRGDAEQAAINGVASGLSSASATNFGGCSVKNNAVVAGICTQVAKCSDVGALLTPSITLGTVAGATIYLLADTAGTVNGTATTCTIKRDVNSSLTVTATYQAIGAGN